MKYLLFIISILMIVTSCSNNISDNRNVISIDNSHFEFELPNESKELEDLKKIMLELNDKILYLAVCDTNDSKFLFMVSKYIAPNKMSIEDAFTQSVETTTNFNTDSLKDNFELIDYKTYDVQGTTIRYKISKHFDKAYTIMYYFMKDDYSNELYEIKTSTTKEGLSKAKIFCEKVALSVSIK